MAIGRIRSLRVEGFGTMKPRVMWYKTPGVSEEQPQRGDRGRRGEGRRGDFRDRGGAGTVHRSDSGQVRVTGEAPKNTVP